MKAEELRIGNIVHCVLSDKDVVVQGINKSNPSYAGYYYIEFDNGSRTCIEDFNGDKFISGIPLTPEILENCPDVKKMDSVNWHVRLGATYLQLQFHSAKCYCTFPDGLYLGELATLHRLQNLVHSLTGTELTITI